MLLTVTQGDSVSRIQVQQPALDRGRVDDFTELLRKMDQEDSGEPQRLLLPVNAEQGLGEHSADIGRLTWKAGAARETPPRPHVHQPWHGHVQQECQPLRLLPTHLSWQASPTHDEKFLETQNPMASHPDTSDETDNSRNLEAPCQVAATLW